MVLHTVRGQSLNIRKISLVLNVHAKWSALLVYSVMCLRKFDFCFAKNRCTHIFSVLSPDLSSTIKSETLISQSWFDSFRWWITVPISVINKINQCGKFTVLTLKQSQLKQNPYFASVNVSSTRSKILLTKVEYILFVSQTN